MKSPVHNLPAGATLLGWPNYGVDGRLNELKTMDDVAGGVASGGSGNGILLWRITRFFRDSCSRSCFFGSWWRADSCNLSTIFCPSSVKKKLISEFWDLNQGQNLTYVASYMGISNPFGRPTVNYHNVKNK